MLQSTALCFCFAGQAIAAPPRVPVPPRDYHAAFSDRLPTSGGRLAGLLDGTLDGKISEAAIVVQGIGDRDASICVSIKQVSGGYSATFTVPNPRRGPEVAFLLPREKFRAVGSEASGMAVLARASPDAKCSDQHPMLAASWGGSSGTLLALVNTHQADNAMTVSPRPGGDCVPLTSVLPNRALTSYQVACPVRPPSGCGAAYPLVIELDHADDVSFVRATLRRRC